LANHFQGFLRNGHLHIMLHLIPAALKLPEHGALW